MLQALSVQNYALIDKIEIDFMSGLSIITGETGAGKSILLGAMSLILGQRADMDVLRDKTQKCIVEGVFGIGPYQLQEFFGQNELDYTETAVLRREIATNGKSRAFINDTPVNLTLLRELVLKLVDIHSQHENLELNNHLFHLKVLDICSGSMELRNEYGIQYKAYRSLEQQYHQLLSASEKSKTDLDYYQFQYNQLTEARMAEGEEKDLENEQLILAHAEEIRTNLASVYEKLQGDGASTINLLKDAAALVQKIRNYYPGAEDIQKRLESSSVELKDIASETGSFAASIETDPARLEFITARLDLLNSLMQKHRVVSVHELLRIRDELQARLHEITSFDFRIDELKKELDSSLIRLEGLAKELTTSRKKVSPAIEKNVTSILKDLGIPNARFEIHLEPVSDYGPIGKDKAEFMFSANKQAELQEISRVASGGELSRLMLSIKSLLTKSMDLPTIIFDEIDAGVSGEIAYRVGNMVREMAETMQVISITHLPQVAAKGQHHYLVYKKDSKTATHTYMRLLTPDERITEIAKMISGEELTNASYQNARELLGLN